jgi:iron complex outermembrane receptor protein
VNAEVRYLTTRFERQKITVGAEYQKNGKQNQANFDVEPYFSYLDDSRNSETLGLYIQDEIRFSDQLILNAGIRYDNNRIDAGNNNQIKNSIVNPRLALIYSAQPETTLKLIYGTAYRNPNAYELYYGQVLDYLPSTDLQPEEIATYEFNAEHFVNNNFRLITAVFLNDTKNLIGINSDPATGDLFFDNFGEVQALGAEIEAEYVSNNELRLRTSYSYVNTEDKDTGNELINSPNSMVRLNLSAPVLRNKADGALEFRYMSERATEAGAIAGGYGITNITLSSKEIYKRLVLSASLYNLFDRQYFDPVSDEHTQDSIEQDGRTFRVKATYTF